MRHERQIGKQRKRRGFRVRNQLKRHATRPRLAVFRSHENFYAQIIDDAAGRTLVAASTLDKQLQDELKYGGKHWEYLWAWDQCLNVPFPADAKDPQLKVMTLKTPAGADKPASASLEFLTYTGA